jgi:hypothetical protein
MRDAFTTGLGTLAMAACCGCADQPLGTSRFPATASYTAQATEAGPGSQDEVHVTAELTDCVGPKLVLGPGCELAGTWSDGAHVAMTAWSAGFRSGTLTLAAGQTCVMPLGGGTAEDIAITRGVVRISEAHVADVSIAAEVASGSNKGRTVTFVFNAPAEGPPRPCGAR